MPQTETELKQWSLEIRQEQREREIDLHFKDAREITDKKLLRKPRGLRPSSICTRDLEEFAIIAKLAVDELKKNEKITMTVDNVKLLNDVISLTRKFSYLPRDPNIENQFCLEFIKVGGLTTFELVIVTRVWHEQPQTFFSHLVQPSKIPRGYATYSEITVD